jgi:hypothetical protein
MKNLIHPSGQDRGDPRHGGIPSHRPQDTGKRRWQPQEPTTSIPATSSIRWG